MENGFSLGSRLFLFVVVGTQLFVPTLSLGAKHTKLTPEAVPGQVLVKFSSVIHAQAQGAAIQALEKALGKGSVLDLKPFLTDSTRYRFQLKNDRLVQKGISILNQLPQVEYSEPNYIFHALDDGAPVSVPNDADFAKLWGMNNTGQADSAGQVGHPGSDIGVMKLWNQGITGSRNILVAVIDTGIDFTHPDLAANIYTNPGEAGSKATNGIDDDQNGFIDDLHGWDFANKKANGLDDHGHGSHCSGTIGGDGNNGIGVAGVNWQVSLLPVKFLDKSGSGNLQDAVDAINYARMMKVRIMSNSWGGGPETQSLKDAIDVAGKEGILFVAAAGNDADNSDATSHYPASYPLPNVLSVAATDNQDGLAYFSNYGKTTVHVAAPGVNIYSSVPLSVNSTGYDTFSGTSMATPHVAGISALLLSAHPEWSFQEIKDRLILTSDPVPGLARKVVAHGRVNAYNALNNIQAPQPVEPDPTAWVDVPFSAETAHPYAVNEKKTFNISVPGAKYIRVVFDQMELEDNYDFVSFVGADGTLIEKLSGTHDLYTTDYSEGDTAKLEFTSDTDEVRYGFKVTKVQVIY